MALENDHVSTPDNSSDSERAEVLNALKSASVLYERYVDLVEVANIAAFQQSLPLSRIDKAPPLGLVIWPQK
ncbi:MAG: hypothetical protein WBD27_15055 [Pyrinomonadaceae bacterium]